jgi:hypothetical protein
MSYEFSKMLNGKYNSVLVERDCGGTRWLY